MTEQKVRQTTTSAACVALAVFIAGALWFVTIYGAEAADVQFVNTEVLDHYDEPNLGPIRTWLRNHNMDQPPANPPSSSPPRKPSPSAVFNGARGYERRVMGIPVRDLPKDEKPDSKESELKKNPKAAEIDQLCFSESDHMHDRQYDKAEAALNEAIKLNEPYFDSGLYHYLANELCSVYGNEGKVAEREQLRRQCLNGSVCGIQKESRISI